MTAQSREEVEKAAPSVPVTAVDHLDPHRQVLQAALNADRKYRRVKAQSAERVERYRQARDAAILAASASGHSFSEIAVALGVSKARVQQLVQRARSEPASMKR